MMNLTNVALCNCCDCYHLCKRIVKSEPRYEIQCIEIRKLVLEIIAKNCDDEDYD